MSLVSGKIGFATEEETESGYVEDSIVEKPYHGSIKKNNQRFSVANTIQGDLKITNVFSLTGDSYLFKHITDIKYFVWQGEKWIIENLSYDFPRIEFTIGGIYHGSQGTTPEYSGEY